MYYLELLKKFSATTLANELACLITGTNQFDELEIIISTDKKQAQIKIKINSNYYFIDICLFVTSSNFLENGFWIKFTDDNGNNLLEFNHFDSINRIMQEYWRNVRPDFTHKKL